MIINNFINDYLNLNYTHTIGFLAEHLCNFAENLPPALQPSRPLQWLGRGLCTCPGTSASSSPESNPHGTATGSQQQPGHEIGHVADVGLAHVVEAGELEPAESVGGFKTWDDSVNDGRCPKP